MTNRNYSIRFYSPDSPATPIFDGMGTLSASALVIALACENDHTAKYELTGRLTEKGSIKISSSNLLPYEIHIQEES